MRQALMALSLVVLVVGCGCSKKGGGDNSSPVGEQLSPEVQLEQTSGLRQNELFLDQHVAWNEEEVRELHFELNASTACQSQECTVSLEASQQRDEGFNKVGELGDEGDNSDRTANDGIYSAKVSFHSSTLKDRLFRFRARVENTGAISNLVYLSVMPKPTVADTTAFHTTSASFVGQFRNIKPDKVNELQQLVAQVKAAPGVKHAAVSTDGNAMIVVSKAGQLAVLERETAPQMKSVPRFLQTGLLATRASLAGDTSSPTPASKLKCGGWEGNTTVIAPYFYDFASDDGVNLGNKIEADSQKRFKVDIVKGHSQGSGSLAWFSDIFDGRNGIVISSHGGRYSFKESEVPNNLDSQFHLETLPGQPREAILYIMATNAPAPVGPPAGFNHNLGNSIAVSPSSKTILVTPSFFAQQKGVMRTQAFAYLGFCFSGMNLSGFVSAFSQRGAKVVYSYSNMYPAGSWADGNVDRIATQILDGKPLSEVSTGSSHSFTYDGKPETVNFQVARFAKDNEDVRFAPAKDQSNGTLTMMVGDNSVSLLPYGCFHHDTPLNIGKVWTCRWTRTGEADSSPALNINIPTNGKPSVGTLHGFDANMSYGDKECTTFNSFNHPERLTVKILSWSDSSMSVQFDAVLTNNGPLIPGEGGFEMKTIKDGNAFNVIRD